MECNHDHDHDHDHGHDDGPIVEVGLSQQHADTASRSLSSALGWSFKLLTVIMIVVGVGFLFTGVKQIKNNQVGLKKVFGKIVDDNVQPGLAITWPYPIGEIEVVSVQPQKLIIEDLWMNETPQDKTQPDLSKRIPPPGGLKPGWDGALYTADKNLLHLKLKCTFAVSDVGLFKKSQLQKYIVKDPERQDLVVEPVRTAVVVAAIHTAATWTAERVQDHSREFLTEVQYGAQDRLKELQSGIRIIDLTIDGITRPLAVRPMYDAAQAARAQKEAVIIKATSDANGILNDACGPEVRRILLGDSSFYGGNFSSPSEGSQGLIGQYNKVRDEEERARLDGREDARRAAHDQAETILAQIDGALVSQNIGGRAFKIISDARTSVTAIRQNLEGRTRRFDELKAEYLKNPQFMLNSLWLQARQELLDDPTLVKFYLDTSEGKTVILINHDPDILREIQKRWQESSGKLDQPPSLTGSGE